MRILIITVISIKDTYMYIVKYMFCRFTEKHYYMRILIITIISIKDTYMYIVKFVKLTNIRSHREYAIR